MKISNGGMITIIIKYVDIQIPPNEICIDGVSLLTILILKHTKLFKFAQNSHIWFVSVLSMLKKSRISSSHPQLKIFYKQKFALLTRNHLLVISVTKNH